MAIPYYCRKCGDVIGMEREMASLGRLHSGKFDSSVDIPCPGKGKHPQSVRSEKIHFFNLLKRVTLRHPDVPELLFASSHSTWEEYIGPSNKFWLWFAIVFATEKHPNGSYKGVVVNGQWCWWNWKIGFYGDGIKELPGLARS